MFPQFVSVQSAVEQPRVASKDGTATVNSLKTMEPGIPFLDKATSRAWHRFLEDLTAYRGRGGVRSVVHLISPTVMRTLSLRVRLMQQDEDGSVREEEQAAFVRRVTQSCAPASVPDAMDVFKDIVMQAKTGTLLDAVLSYVQAFEAVEMQCHGLRIADTVLSAAFLDGLRPARLGDRVRYRGVSALAEIKRAAVEEAVELDRAVREVAKLGQSMPVAKHSGPSPVDPMRPGPKPQPKAHSDREAEHAHGGGERRPGGDARLVVRGGGDARHPPATMLKCFTCLEPGHKARDCPSGKRWQREGTRLVRDETRAGSMEAKGKAGVDGQHVDGLRRMVVQLQTPHGRVTANALLDTGANQQFVSRAVYDKLLELGVVVRKSTRRIETLAGAVVPDVEVSCTLRVDVERGGVCSAVSKEVNLLVIGGLTEEAVIGMPVLEELGLLESAVGIKRDLDWEGELPEVSIPNKDSAEPRDPELPVIEDGPGAEELRELLGEYKDVFGPLPKEGADLPEMVIEVKAGATLPVLPPRRLSAAMQDVVDNSVAGWLDAGIITESTSPYSSPLVIVPKKDGGYRPCVDFRVLNQGTVDLRFPLQNTRAILDRMLGQRVFGTLDLQSGFHQIPLALVSQPLTAFATAKGLYEFKRVQFGAKTAPAHFQRCMSIALSGLLGTVCDVYIDDVIVYARDMPTFIENLRLVLQRLRKHRLRAKAVKCHLGLPRVEYLGHVVDGNGVTLTEERKQGLKCLMAPKTQAQLRSFIGLASYFRSFVPDFARIAKPLHTMCSTKSTFKWSDEAQAAFDRLKTAIIDAPVLHHIDYANDLVIRTDASTQGVGGVLLQIVDGKEVPVCFVSKAFDETEMKWSTIEQELYAVVFTVMKLQHHLRGHFFRVESDHRNLMYLEKSDVPKLVRWRLRLQEFNFELRHIAGKENKLADGLSRCLVGIEIPHCDDIKAVHNSVMGHRGISLTESLLRERGLEWDTMTDDVKTFIATCAVCQKVRLGQGSAAAALATIAVTEPFEEIAIDTIGPLPADAYGNEFIIVVIDCFSRFVELRAAREVTALEAAKALLDVFGRYGAPRRLRSDNGSQFTAAIIDNFLNLVGVGRYLTVPYRPESNGLLERANREVGRHLRSLVMEQRVSETWSICLPMIQRIINATPNRTIGTMPARVMFGGAVHLDRALLQLPGDDNEDDDGEAEEQRRSTVEDYITTLIDDQRRIVDAARAHQQALIDKVLAGNPESPVEYENGEYVLVSYPERPPTKLHPKWRGPMVVVGHTNHVYECQDLNDMKLQKVHISRLKPYRVERTDDPLAVAAVDSAEYVVDRIVDQRVDGPRGQWRFRVRWRGYEPDQDSWLPIQELREVAAFRAYALEHPELHL